MEKRLVFLISVLLVAVLLTGCRRAPRNTDAIDGGVRNNQRSDAPKTIVSTKIASFSCVFSTLDLVEESSLGQNVYVLQAQESEGAVWGSYLSGETEKQVFETDSSFMELLQEIVARYDLAQYNGINYYVSGLPDRYGADLHISYQSEEEIYASNNQDCFLPLAAMEELQHLFFEQIK